jgi:predicted RNA binding protein YcfA (HicA-like mRNA interferase family)
LLKALTRAGFREVRRSGSHIRLQRADGSHGVTVPYHAAVIIKPKTLKAILLYAGLTVTQLIELL